MVGRLLRSTDFVRVLAAAPRARSAHFALHHLATRPSASDRVQKAAAKAKLSTGDAPSCPPAVDDLPAPGLVASAPDQCWLGTVVPKRHAKRAVTRNLIKRQMRALMADHAPGLPPGLWVLRLKAPFDPRQFTSAASAPLRARARAELTTLFERARPQPAAPV
ncbi:MAG: ribonuclease P protein component [Burkholderiales bacterium PBB5]|nr:MAG: ribonuclease P protein component [Burkholderiales bacterium PBB5]